MTDRQQIIVDLEVNIARARESLQEMKNISKDGLLGKAGTKKSDTELQDLIKKFDQLKTKIPTINSGEKEFKEFFSAVKKTATEVDKCVGKMTNFDVTDDYIKKNVVALREFVQKADEASKKVNNIKMDIGKTAKDGSVFQTPREKNKSKKAVDDMRAAAEEGNVEAVRKAGSERAAELTALRDTHKPDTKIYKTLDADLKQINDTQERLVALAGEADRALAEEGQAAKELEGPLREAGDAARKTQEDIVNQGTKAQGSLKNISNSAEQVSSSFTQIQQAGRSIGELGDQLMYLFSATSIFYALSRVLSDITEDFKELDQQFNEIAIVSDKSTSEMWEQFSSVNEIAQKFGVTTKNVLEVQNLYYHQGKETTEVNKLTAQTLTLAKITGMDYAKATSDLTAALNAYKMEADEAVRVTDTIAAMDTNAAISSEELMKALTKTASIAANAGMSLESTEIFLTKMIETTREAPENLGTALKTIIARFGEVKEEIDGEEIELADINRVDTALKTVGITLLDTAGQIRDLDGVFLELSSKWDDLDRNTQRYIATIAAGSRQQSRFIAMMEDYDRTLELTDAMNNSAGIGARQLAKSMESIETATNTLKSSWQEFTQKIIKNNMFTGALNAANKLLGVVNELPGPIIALGLAIGAWALKTKVINKAMIAHDVIQRGLQENLPKEQIATNLRIQLRQKEAGSLANIMAIKKAYSAQVAKGGAQEISNASLQAAAIKWLEEVRSGATREEAEAILVQELVNKGLEENIAKTIAHATAIEAEEEALEDLNEERAKSLVLEKARNAKKNHTSSGDKTGGQTPLTFKESFKDSYQRGKNNLARNGKDASMKEAYKGFFSRRKDDVVRAGGAIKTGFSKAIASIGGFLGTLVSILPVLLTIAGTIAIIAGTVYLLHKNFNASLDDTKQVEKLSKAQEEYNKQLKASNDLKEKAKKYKDYVDSSGKVRGNLTEEERVEQQDLAKELVEAYPALLEKIDEEGNYHLKNASAIQAEIEAKEKLVKESAETYSKAKLKQIDNGIYADTSTQAGQAIKNMQDYAATFGTEKLHKNDSLKEIAEYAEGTSDLNFNKSKFYDIMEGYAKGEKFSFGRRDMTDLFEGEITTDKGWNLLLEDIRKTIDKGEEINKDNLAQALEASGAYGEKEAERVAATFLRLDEKLGGMYSDLLEGAAFEEANILIETAKMEVNSIDFSEDIGDSFKTAIAKAATVQAESSYGDKWDALDDEDKTDEVEKIIEQWSPAFEKLSKQQVIDLEKFIDPEKTGEMLANESSKLFKSFGEEVTDRDKKEELLTQYYNFLSEETRKSIKLTDISGATDEVINSLFEAIRANIDDYDTSQDWNDLINEIIPAGAIAPSFQGITNSQKKALIEKTVGLDKESQKSFLENLSREYKSFEETDALSRSDFLNTLLKQDFSNELGIIQATRDLKKFGYTAEQVSELAVRAMNGINNISLSSFEDTINEIEKKMESLQEGLEGMTALLSGSATLAQFKSYMTVMESSWVKTMGIEEARKHILTLYDSIEATGDGLKITADKAEQYGKRITEVEKESALAMIAFNKGVLANNNRTAEEKLEAAKKIAIAQIYYSQISAAEQKAHWEGVIDDLEKAKEKADEFLDSIKALVEWFRNFDRFASLDRVISDLEKAGEHLDFEIEFSTNADVIEEDIKKSIENVNSQLAANQGGLAAAKDEEAMWKDILQKRNSEYVSFTKDGTATLDHERLIALQKQIASADEASKPALQATYDEIMANVDAYNKAREKVNSYSSAVEKNLKAVEELMKTNYENITKVQEKLIETRIEQEDRELEKVKEKYDAIKEENDEYLDSVRDMIDKEREIRDRANSEQDVRDKEKKLAMMKMDTSGVYTKDIQALEKELEDDYQSLEDDAVDRAIDKMEEDFQKSADAMDKEIEYMENTLEYKREKMTEYNAWATQLLQQGSDAIIAYLKANDEEYYTGSAEQQALWEMEWNNSTAKAVASNEVLKDSMIESIFNTLDSCKDNAKGFEGAVEEYSKTAVARNGEVEGSVSDLIGSYEGLATRVSGITSALDRQASAYNDAARAARNLKSAQDALNNIVGERAPDVAATPDNYTPAPPGSNNNSGGDPVPKFEPWKNETFGNDVSVYDTDRYSRSGSPVIGADGESYIPFSYQDREKGKEFTVWFKENDPLWDDDKEEVYWGQKWYKRVYKTGGFAYETGPAWLDGTPKRPEAVLNALQTQHFIKFIDVLDTLFSGHATSFTTPIRQTQSETQSMYNINITVDQMSSDYDVDRMIERMEEKLIKASRYRNVTTLTKSTSSM